MATATRITNVYLDVLTSPTAASAEARTTQMAIEVVYTPPSSALQVKGYTVEVLLQSPRAVSPISGSTVFFIVSGTSYVNAIGNTPLVVSTVWDLTGGVAPITYDWQFSNVEGEVGFVSTATSADTTRTYTNAGDALAGKRGLSATVTDANSNVSAAHFVHIKAEQTPNPFDGPFQGENQPRRRVYP